MNPSRVSPHGAFLVMCMAGLALLAAGAGLLAARGPDPDAVPTARQVYDRTMSPYCPGLTLAACPSTQAIELRKTISDMVTGAGDLHLEALEPRRTPGVGERPRGASRHLSRRPRPPRGGSPPLRPGGLRVIPALLVVAFAGLALWILGPLRAPSRRMEEEGDSRWKELVDAKHAIYRSILDLEFDRAVAKVSEEDYTVLRRQQEAEALAVLTEIDALASTTEASPDTLEAEIAAARERLRPLS